MDHVSFWANLIDDLMKEQGVSNRALACTTRISRNTIKRIRVGKSRPTVAHMEAILAVLGYQLDAFPIDQRGEE